MDPAEEIVDEYFEYLAERDVYRAPTVLSWFTDYIDSHNENAIYKLLQHSLATEAIAGLVDLLEFDDKRLTESVVHILGTIVEHPRCRQYVLEVPRNTASRGQTNPTLFTALVNMLMSEDKNVVMNAAGTIANIAESQDGRLWILQQAAFDDALPILGVLTVDPHQWAASNSALVIARLTLSQEGIVKLLTHERSSFILTNLSVTLCGPNPGSSMNAAFAIGRLLEREDARAKLLAMKNFKNTMTALTKMLYNKEAGPRKNACFAFSCLANSKEGHDRLLCNVNSELILDQLVRLITDPDSETAWFAAVTLRCVCSQKEGVFRLRDHKSVYTVLKKLVKGTGVKLKSDLFTEVKLTLDILGKLPKLPAPILTTLDSSSVAARWDSVIATQGSKTTYQLYQGCTCVYEGTKTSTRILQLKPFTSYVFRVRATNRADEGPYSGPAIVTTNEGVPGPPGEVNNEGKPQHNSIKISWLPPPNPNGTLTGYHIFCNGDRVGVIGTIDKLQYTVKDLPHSTSVAIQVAGVTAAGEGDKSTPIMCSTLNLSEYPPKRPILSTSGGANEINVSWIDPPKQLGPIDHYELVMNGQVIYNGKDQSYRVSNLEPLKEYTFNVRVVTSDKYVIESEPAKKKAGSKVVQKNGISGTESEEDLPQMTKERTPTPEIAKPVSETREIIRPKKKADRFTVNKKLPQPDKSKTRGQKGPIPVPDPRQGLDTIDEVSAATLATTPSPRGVSDVKVVPRVPPNTGESAALVTSSETVTSSDPRGLAARSLSTLVDSSKRSVSFSNDVCVNSSGSSHVERINDVVDDSTFLVYVPNVVSSRVKAFHPELIESVSDTAISVENDSHDHSVEFLVNYVTTFNTKSEGPENTSVNGVTSSALTDSTEKEKSEFSSKTYKEALGNLEQSVEQIGDSNSTNSNLGESESPSVTYMESEARGQGSLARSQSSDLLADKSSESSLTNSVLSDPKTALNSLTSMSSMNTSSTSSDVINSEVDIMKSGSDVAKYSDDFTNYSSDAIKSTDDITNSSRSLNAGVAMNSQCSDVDVVSGKTNVNDLTTSETSNVINSEIKNGGVNSQDSVKSHTKNTYDGDKANNTLGGDNANNTLGGDNANNTCNGDNIKNTCDGTKNTHDGDIAKNTCNGDNVKNTFNGDGANINNTFGGDNVRNTYDGDDVKNTYDGDGAKKTRGGPDNLNVNVKNAQENEDDPDKESSRSTKHATPSDNELGAVQSLSDIHVMDTTSSTSGRKSKEMKDKVRSKDDHQREKKNLNKFNINDVRTKESGIEEQNKLITALIAQQNTDLNEQNRRTKDIIDSVRNNIRNAIAAKRDKAQYRQISSNKFISAVNQARRNVKLSSVNMDMFGDMGSLQSPGPRGGVNLPAKNVNHPGPQLEQIPHLHTSSQFEKPKRKTSKKKNVSHNSLPPIEKRTAVHPRDISFNFPKI